MWVFIYILLIHWFADFILQTRHMATRKSSSNYYLTMHVLIYSFATIVLWILFFLAVEIPMSRLTVFGAMGITFVTHWLTDYITSRYTTKYFLAKKDKEFYNMIGFDQLIHALTLFLTYNYIIL
jgi:hypothetical protein